MDKQELISLNVLYSIVFLKNVFCFELHSRKMCDTLYKYPRDTYA